MVEKFVKLMCPGAGDSRQTVGYDSLQRRIFEEQRDLVRNKIASRNFAVFMRVNSGNQVHPKKCEI